jgi:hypothetical protein
MSVDQPGQHRPPAAVDDLAAGPGSRTRTGHDILDD